MKRLLFFLSGLLLPASASAAGVHLTDYGWDCTGFLRCNIPGDVFSFLLNNLITGVLSFIVLLATVVFFYGAFRMAASQGEEGKEVGKKALLYASLGLVLAILAGAIIEFVCGYVYLVGGTPGGMCPIWP